MKLYVSLAVIIIACITTPVQPQRWQRQRQLQQQQQDQYCVTPENYYGTCVTLSFCPQIANVFQTVNRRQAQQYVILSQRACGTRSVNGDPVVCCTRPQTNQRPTEGPNVSNNNNPFLPNTQRTTQAPQQTTPRPQFTTRATTRSPPTTNSNLIEDKGTSCRGPDARDGTCVPIQNCKILVDELQAKPSDEKFARFLRASNTICGGTATNVCCPSSLQRTTTTRGPLIRSSSEIPTRLPTVEEGCGYSNNSYKKIVGGEVSKKGAWPWVALIGYDDELSASPFKCGGTLITARHVITAAHCIRNDISFVRLGEHDLTTDTETRHVDIRIARYDKNLEYNRRNGRADIAILYLERNVIFTDLISPICLPASPDLRQKSYLSYKPFVVGWGKTMEGGSSSNVLNELQIPFYDNQVCMESYRLNKRLFTADQFDQAVLCAGDLSGGKDTCQGDSGGPLMVPEIYGEESRFYLIGVVSYGIGCARPEIPGVYASTQYFMDWIEQKVAATVLIFASK